MGVYNVRLYNYADNKQQCRIYTNPIISGTEEIKLKSDKRLETIKINKSENKQTQFQKEECERISTNRTKKTIYEIARSNIWEYFVTLTFDPQKIDSTDYNLVTKKLSMWLNNIKKKYAPDMYYIFVPELHKDGKKYHFHGIIGNVGKIEFKDSGIIKNDKIIYNMPQYKYGFTTATKVQSNDAICAYITKYITKDLCAMTKNKRRYWVSKNAQRPEVIDYNMTPEEKQNILDTCMNNITYIKTLDIPIASQKIKYIEMQ